MPLLSAVYLPHSVMVPPRRLVTLLSQAVERQIDVCQYHNTQINAADYVQTANFLTDHVCSKLVGLRVSALF